MKSVRNILMFFFILYVISFSACTCRGLPPEPVDKGPSYALTLGDVGEDGARDVIQLSDGTYVIAGYKTVTGKGKEMYLGKFGQDGTMIWETTAGSTADDALIELIPFGTGFAAVGYTFRDGTRDMLIASFDSLGATNWTWNLSHPGNDQAEDLIADGSDLVVVGWTNSKGCVVIKMPDTGASPWWIHGFYTNSGLVGYGICKAETGYAVAGTRFTNTATDMAVLKLTDSGSLEWVKYFGVGANLDAGYDIERYTIDNSLVVGGTGERPGLGSQAYFVRLDSSGNTIWEVTHGESGSDQLYAVSLDPAGYVMAAGFTTQPTSGGTDVMVMQIFLDSGAWQWTRNHGGTAGERGWSVIKSSELGYMVTGDTLTATAGSYDLYILKLDSSGNL